MQKETDEGLPRKLPNPGFLLRFYSAIGRISMPVWKIALRIREGRGKEDAARLGEKFGQTLVSRPEGRLVWLHGVSVGESMALRPLIEELSAAQPDLNFLLTSSTTASAQALEQNGLPPRTIHQFAPVDTRVAVDRFLNHWRPDAIGFSERDFWPGLIRWTQEWGSKRGVMPVLVNSRMSSDSFQRRNKVASLFRDLLGGFPKILLQDEGSRERFLALGVKNEQLEVVGSIKAGGAPLPDVPDVSIAFSKAAAGRPVWLAASTHAQEVQTIVDAHSLAKQAMPDLLTIVAPRKPDVFEQQAQAASAAGLNVALRSSMPDDLSRVDMLVVDAIGEMGVWFRASDLVFMGFSLPSEGPSLTGKNPFEALALGAAVVHGPDTTNFAESYEALDAAGATRQVNSVEELAALIVGRDGLPEMQSAAQAWLADAARLPLQRTRDAILDALDRVPAA